MMSDLDRVLARIAAEIRPKLDLDKSHDGYNCCGCATYEQIVNDIEAIIREEATKAGHQATEKGLRYAPDFSGIEGSSVFIQWKGTDVCLDFTCECGARGHFDGEFAYAIRCGACGRAWALPHTVAVVPLPDSWDSVDPVDVEPQ